MQDTDMARVGAPLLEQDAEFLLEEIRDEGFPAEIERSTDPKHIDTGRCYFVRVQAKHLPFARRIRAANFTEREPAARPHKAARKGLQKRELIGAGASAAGCLMGIPVALVLQGGALMAVMTGGALSLVAMLMTLVFTVGTGGPPTAQQQAPGATPTAIARKEGNDRRKDERA
jgi:hypothetical protein